jgi:hypothetical protein
MSKGLSDPQPTTSHRGYDIRYGMNSDTWTCGDLNLEAEKLSTLKGQIDRAIRRFNEEGIEVISLGLNGGSTPAKITASYLRQEQVQVDRGRYERQPVRKVDSYQEGRYSGDGKKRLHRGKDLREFAPDNPTTHAMLAEHERLSAAAEVARKKADDYWNSIPRITEADIAPLIDPAPDVG